MFHDGLESALCVGLGAKGERIGLGWIETRRNDANKGAKESTRE
jgi:hypothetical protein